MTDKMILGEGAICSTDCSQTGLNNNVLVCGASGCGKTMSVTEARLLETFHSSVIATDTKRRNVGKYKPVFRRRGYIVEDLNFINPPESDVAYEKKIFTKNVNNRKFLKQRDCKINSISDSF